MNFCGVFVSTGTLCCDVLWIGCENKQKNANIPIYTTHAGQSNGDLRLNNDKELLSTEVTAGRLEIYLNSEWGTICDDNFHQVEASVACKQLGFSGVLSYGVTGSLGCIYNLRK